MISFLQTEILWTAQYNFNQIFYINSFSLHAAQVFVIIALSNALAPDGRQGISQINADFSPIFNGENRIEIAICGCMKKNLQRRMS